MKPCNPLIFALLILLALPAAAETATRRDPATDGADIFVDLVIVRPLSLAATVAGTGLFLGFSPFTALATLIPPHDAILRAGNAFVGLPACYAFRRPLGYLVGDETTTWTDRSTGLCTW